MTEINKKISIISQAISFVFLLTFGFVIFAGIASADITDSGTISVTAIVPPKNTLIFSGKACPNCTAHLEKDGVGEETSICAMDGSFQLSLVDLDEGTYLFEIYAQDTENIFTSTWSYTLAVSDGTLTTVSNITLSPTLQTDKDYLVQEEKITFFGQTVPSSVVTILIDDSSPFIQVNSASDGGYYYVFNAESLTVGQHKAKARVTSGGVTSSYSPPVKFKINKKTDEVQELSTCGQSDFNGDNKVDLVDFSILLYWYGENNISDDVDLSGSGKIDIQDFSILMYCWNE